MRMSKASKSITTNDISALCLEIKTDMNFKYPIVVNFSTSSLKVLISGESLISRLSNARNLYINGTFKTTTCNYPIVVVVITVCKVNFI